MTGSLERRYRRLLSAYPGSYRRQRGDEILTTLLDMSAPGRDWPAPREVAGLLVGAARTRMRINLSRPAREVWAGGLRLAALILLAEACSQAATQAGLDLTNLSTTLPAETAAFIVATVLSAGALASVASGRYWLGCAAVVGAGAAEMVGSHGFRTGPATLFGPAQEYFWPLASGLAVCAALAWVRPPTGRGLWWLLAVPPAAVILPNQYDATVHIQPYAAFAFLAVCLLSTVVDARVPVAGAAVCLSYAAYLLYFLQAGWFGPEVWPAFDFVTGLAGLLLASIPLGRLVLRSRSTNAR